VCGKGAAFACGVAGQVGVVCGRYGMYGRVFFTRRGVGKRKEWSHPGCPEAGNPQRVGSGRQVGSAGFAQSLPFCEKVRRRIGRQAGSGSRVPRQAEEVMCVCPPCLPVQYVRARKGSRVCVRLCREEGGKSGARWRQIEPRARRIQNLLGVLNPQVV